MGSVITALLVIGCGVWLAVRLRRTLSGKAGCPGCGDCARKSCPAAVKMTKSFPE